MPTPTLEDYDALPLFYIALEDRSSPVGSKLRRQIPAFDPGLRISPLLGYEPVVYFARLWWWN